ncbi:MAG: DUF1573 domain-containing protein [Saprospirales bacterium]|jgi:hypothetical protein|nr:DUF1573 domain-containing protein [Saprospirales bacterium]MBK6904579.1 DUF1573 domain-containing protein [Saprospirales bacterium]MBK7336212.1 DUF1573 domain-containing protein [Saprospirales bacterium]
MNRSRFIVFAVVFAGLLSCNSDPSSGKRVEEVPVEGPISAIIRNPATANQPLDTVNVAKLTFEYEEFDFGSVAEGEEVTHVFRFKNTGKVPLLITDARSTCGCTVPTWPREPVSPGQGGEIKVVFNTLNKSGQQRKEVAVTANTYPAQTTVFLTGKVSAPQQ